MEPPPAFMCYTSYLEAKGGSMARPGAIAMLAALLFLPVVSLAQATDEERAPSQPVAAFEDSSAVFTRSTLLFLSDYPYKPETSLPQSIYLGKGNSTLLNFEVYRASRLECALQGASAGMTLGMATGAFGMMTGTWDERSAWYITGAMAAFGAIFGGTVKADDPTWNLRIRWEPNR